MVKPAPFGQIRVENLRPPSSLRGAQRRSNPATPLDPEALLDCFAALAMTI
jgi:hypothetical protein